jgi:hypothetical protein
LAKVASTFAGDFSCLGFRVSRLLLICPLAIGSILSISKLSFPLSSWGVIDTDHPAFLGFSNAVSEILPSLWAIIFGASDDDAITKRAVCHGDLSAAQRFVRPQ